MENREPVPKKDASQKTRLFELLNIPRNRIIAMFALRLGIGGFMLQSGITKFVQGFSVTNFLTNSKGPFSGFYIGLATYSDFFNAFIPWTEVLIGAALILGIFVRVASFLGAVEIFLFYLAYLPPQQGWINSQLIYILVFVALLFSRSGYFLGLDYFGIRQEIRRRRLRFVLG